MHCATLLKDGCAFESIYNREGVLKIMLWLLTKPNVNMSACLREQMLCWLCLSILLVSFVRVVLVWCRLVPDFAVLEVNPLRLKITNVLKTLWF